MRAPQTTPRNTINLVGDIIANWDPTILEPYWRDIEAGIKEAISDTDGEARSNARATLDILKELFPQREAALFKVGGSWRDHPPLQTLEPSKQKIIRDARAATAQALPKMGRSKDDTQCEELEIQRELDSERAEVCVQRPVAGGWRSTARDPFQCPASSRCRGGAPT